MTANEKIYHAFFLADSHSRRGSPQKDKDLAISNKDSNTGDYQVSQISNMNQQFKFTSGNFKPNLSPLLLNPNLSEPERKAIEAWEREMRF